MLLLVACSYLYSIKNNSKIVKLQIRRRIHTGHVLTQHKSNLASKYLSYPHKENSLNKQRPLQKTTSPSSNGNSQQTLLSLRLRTREIVKASISESLLKDCPQQCFKLHLHSIIPLFFQFLVFLPIFTTLYFTFFFVALSTSTLP